MKKIVLIIGVIIAVFAVYYWTHPLSPKVRIKGEVFTIDVALTPSQKEKGLSGRASLGPNEGMLFPFDHKEEYNFWMKGMLFPLDFLWIDDTTITDISENIPAPVGNEPPAVVSPKGGVNRILELPAGTVARLGIVKGDTVEFLKR